MARAWQEYIRMPFPRERRAERHIKSSQAKVQMVNVNNVSPNSHSEAVRK